jgi:hypothetical protein
VDYLLPLYKEVNSYPHLVDKGISGNPDELRAEELGRRGWAIVEPLFQQARRQAESQYRQLQGSASERAANDAAQIIEAAFYGRIEILFVALGQRVWGRFDADTGAVELHEEKESGDDDLLNRAAIQTMINGGTIYAVPLEEMPDQAALVAVFRY